MREMLDEVEIRTSPERVWTWLTGLSQHYTEWHPDHVSAEWERGEPNAVGSVLRAVEYLGGRREVLRFQVTSLEEPYRFAYRMLGPLSLLLPGGSFTVSPANGHAKFRASISYRFGWLAERIFKRQMTMLITHMKEEGAALKRIMEAQAG